MNDQVYEATKPLFLFINEKYSLYRNPIYYKEQPKTIGGYFKGILAQGIGYFKTRECQEGKEIAKFKTQAESFLKKVQELYKKMD